MTRGDANRTPDPWTVQRREVVGGVVAFVPELGYWLVYLKSLPGLGSVILASVGGCLLWSIARELDEEPSEAAITGGAVVVAESEAPRLVDKRFVPVILSSRPLRAFTTRDATQPSPRPQLKRLTDAGLLRRLHGGVFAIWSRLS